MSSQTTMSSDRVMPSHRVMRSYHLFIALGILFLDRLSKRLVARDISLHDSITVIPRIFYITHVENRGAAFGLFNDSPSGWKIALPVVFFIVALWTVSSLIGRRRNNAYIDNQGRR